MPEFDALPEPGSVYRDVLKLVDDPMTCRVVMGLDCGVTTGWAYCVVRESDLVGAKISQIVDRMMIRDVGHFDCRDHFAGARELALWAREMVEHFRFELVIEDFSLFAAGRGKDVISSARIGCWIAGNVDDVLTPTFYLPGKRGSVSSSDERLRRWGIWDEGKPHARDAMKMVMLHLRHLRTGPWEA